MLDILRADKGETSRLTDLPAMAARLANDRLDITVAMTGELADLPTELHHNAFRIAQEALANVIRHSVADRAIVRITANSRDLTVVVDDNGRSKPGGEPPTQRNGLTGMADRVRVLGGTFAAGPQDPHGWRVRATFPVRSAVR